MATSKYKIAEQVQQILGKGEIQELLEAVKNAIGTVVKNNWFQNKNEGVSEIAGQYVYSFKNIAPSFDEDLEMYYCEIPSSYIDLPHEQGVNLVSWMKSQSLPFIRISNGSLALYYGTDSETMQGNKIYFVESNRIYFPNIVDSEVSSDAKLLLKLSVALDAVDDEAPITISPDVQDLVVNIVLQKYGIKKEETKIT